MPGLLAVADLRLVLKDDNLLALALPLRGGNHLCPINSGRTDNHPFAIGDKQYPIQLNGIALSHIQAFHIYGLTGVYLILPAPGLNNSVNLKPP